MEVVSGAWPEDISGEMVFSTPQNRGGLPYAIFDWGAICRLSLESGTRGAAGDRFAWQVRTIQSPGKRLYDRHPEQFSSGAIGYNSPFGATNCANTAPLPWGDRLYTTWDAGRPVELDPGTLEFVAEVGHIDSWGGPSMPIPGVMPFLFSTAHPVVDPERDCLWTVKLSPVMEPTFGMQPSVVRYDGATEVKHWPLEGISFGGSIHTVSQTRDWVILADSGNFKADPAEMMGGERTLTTDEEVPVWLIRKEQLREPPLRFAGDAGSVHDGSSDRSLLRTMGRHRRRLGRVGGHGPDGSGALHAARRPRRQRPPRRPRRRRSLQHGHGTRDDRRGAVRPRHRQGARTGQLQGGLDVQPPALGDGLERRGHVEADAAPLLLPGVPTGQHLQAGRRPVRGTDRHSTSSPRTHPVRSPRSSGGAWSSRLAGSTPTCPT